MDSINIPKKLIDLLREEKAEVLYGFILDNDTIIKYYKLDPKDTGSTLVYFANIMLDGVAHNHYEDSGKSEVDELCMLPGFYYIITGPNSIYCYLNNEDIQCNLF